MQGSRSLVFASSGIRSTSCDSAPKLYLKARDNYGFGRRTMPRGHAVGKVRVGLPGEQAVEGSDVRAVATRGEDRRKGSAKIMTKVSGVWYAWGVGPDVWPWCISPVCSRPPFPGVDAAAAEWGGSVPWPLTWSGRIGAGGIAVRPRNVPGGEGRDSQRAMPARYDPLA